MSKTIYQCLFVHKTKEGLQNFLTSLSDIVEHNFKFRRYTNKLSEAEYETWYTLDYNHYHGDSLVANIAGREFYTVRFEPSEYHSEDFARIASKLRGGITIKEE